MDPLTALGGVASCLDLIDRIVSLVKHVRHFKRRCHDLERTAMLLGGILRRNQSSMVSAESAKRLLASITEVQIFVLECTEKWNVLQQAREVFMNHKYSRLKGELQNLMNLVVFETTADTKTDVHKNDKKLDLINSHLQEQGENMRVVRDEVSRYLNEKHSFKMTGGNKSSQLSIAFTDGDKRMNVSRDTKYPFSGVLEGVGPVFCVEIKNSLMEQAKISTGTTRLVEIYRRISAGTLVQSFHGIWEHERKTYYVMEDLRNELTIAAALTTNRLPDRLARLRFAYDMANTVAYFHSVGLLIKVITDETVVIRTLEGNEVRPCLANIETARTFMEPTAMTSYDVRFEAAEYQRQRMHTKYTDIWSLGVIIYEITTGNFPFSTPPSQHPDKAFIRQRLADGSLPWGDQQREDGSDDIYAIVGECWNASPALRPSASYVAQTLLEIVARHTAKTQERDPIVSPELKQRVLEVIRASRDGKRGEHIAMGSVVALRRSVERDMDPVSSFLLGAAIWYELPPGGVHEYEDPESFSIQPREVKRAREALQYLEGAVDAGIDEAHKETALAYASLARHYLHASKNTDI